MPKMKTNSAAKKRFRITGSGKVMHKRAAKGHLNMKKSGSRKRNLNIDKVLSPASRALVRKMLPGT